MPYLCSEKRIDGSSEANGEFNTLSVDDGAAATPSLFFTNDDDTGIYRVGADQIGFSAGGTNALTIKGSSIELPYTSSIVATGGVGSNESISFSTTAISLNANGAEYLKVESSPEAVVVNRNLTINTGYVIQGGNGNIKVDIALGEGNLVAGGNDIFKWTSTELDALYRMNIKNSNTDNVLAWEGTGTPYPHYITAAHNGGGATANFFKVFLNDLTGNGVDLGTHEIMKWGQSAAGPNNALIEVNGVLEVKDGAVGTPSLSFIDDPNTGIYRIGADNMGFATNGTLRVDIDNTATTVSNTFKYDGATPTADYVLRTDASGNSSWVDPNTLIVPEAYYRSDGANSSSISDATETLVVADDTDYNTAGGAITYSSGVFTLVDAGVYSLSAVVVFATTVAAGTASLYWKDSTGQQLGRVQAALDATNDTYLTSTCTFYYNGSSPVTETVAPYVIQDSGGAVSLNGGNPKIRVHITKLGNN